MFGYIDTAGRIRIPPRFAEAGEFSEGLAPAAERIGDDSMWYGYIDTSGNWVIPTKYQVARGFREGLAVASIDGLRFGFLYPDGTWAVQPLFNSLSDFHGGFAVARMGMPIIRDQLRAALLDRTGRWRTWPDFDALEYGSGGLMAVRQGNQCGYADTNGTIRIAIKFSYCASFREGHAVVHPSRQDFDSVGLLDESGRWAMGPVLGALGDLREGLSLMRLGPFGGDTSWRYVDKSGTPVFTARFSTAGEFSDGMAAAEIRKDGRYRFGYVDHQGRWAIPPLFDEAENFHQGLAKIRIGHAEGYVRQNGTMAWDPQAPGTGPVPPPRDPW
jgi:hypothetical protein